MSAIVKDDGSAITAQELRDMRHRDLHAVHNQRNALGASRTFMPDPDVGDSVEQCVIDRARLLRLVDQLEEQFQMAQELVCSS